MVGRTIKHYEIEAELGQGGMGVVYRAKDTVLERTVALKFLPPMFAKDDDSRKRFVHEAKAVSALDHPNVAVVHEIGEGDDGEMFIVMAFYEGQTLEDIIADGPVDLDDAARFVLDAARGLESAHKKGIIHRDIKPGNIMVTETGLLKILDFGLAKVQDVTMTMGAMSLGTLAYMSPEQAQGQLVDERTDLWALGVVFYEMLAGKRPFDGPYDAAILYSAANEDHTTVKAWREDTPDHLVAIVDKLLQKLPENRYQSATDLIADLVAATAPPPTVIQPVQEVEAPPGTAADPQTTSSGPSDPMPVIGAGQPTSGMSIQKAIWLVIIAVVVLGTLVTMWVSIQGDPVSDDPGVEAAMTDREQAQQFLRAGIDRLNAGQFSLALAEIERAIAADSTYVSAWSSLAAVYYQLSDFSASVRAAQRAISMDPQSTGAWYNLGMSLAEQDDLDGAVQALETATQINSGFTQAFSAWADLLIEAGRPEDALVVLERGGETAEPALRFIIYKNQGKAYLELGQLSEAITFLESSFRLNAEWSETILLLARAYDEIDDGDQAEVYWELFLEVETDPVLRSEARRRLGL